MTLDVYRGRKTTIQQQPKLEELLGSESYPVFCPTTLYLTVVKTLTRILL